MIYITSDIHFFHKAILNFCPVSRPFANVDEMNETIVTNWNRMISPNDITYILGDVTFGRVQPTVDLLNRLNGKKILIKGNHDHDPLRKESFRNCFESIHDYFELKNNGHLICMFHYPIQSWNKKHYLSIHLHGHVHGNTTGIDGRIMDVGMDNNQCNPFSLDDVVERLSTITSVSTHHEDKTI